MMSRRRWSAIAVLLAAALACAGCVENVHPGGEQVDCRIVEGVQSWEDFGSQDCEDGTEVPGRIPAPSTAQINELAALLSEPGLATLEDAFQFEEGVLGVCISILGGATDREIAEEAPAWFRVNGEEPPVEEVEQIARAIRQQGWCESDWLHTP